MERKMKPLLEGCFVEAKEIREEYIVASFIYLFVYGLYYFSPFLLSKYILISGRSDFLLLFGTLKYTRYF